MHDRMRINATYALHVSLSPWRMKRCHVSLAGHTNWIVVAQFYPAA